MKIWLALVMGVLVSMSLGDITVAKAAEGDSKHVLLIGASVGQAWDIEHLPERTNIQGYTFEYVGEFKFDKSKVLDAVLKRPTNKPDVIIIKECAAYFPGDTEQYKQQMQQWTTLVRANNIVPILATVAPVTTPDVFTVFFVKNLMRKVFRDKVPVDEKLPYIAEFNDWIRSYAKREGIAVLDLERALHVSASDRRLRSDLSAGDGLHLNEKAYSLLDQAAVQTLTQARDRVTLVR